MSIMVNGILCEAHDAKCKICGRSMTIHVAVDYQNDPFKLLGLATCNRCYDLRVKRERIYGALNKMALEIHKTEEQQRAFMDRLMRVSKSFAAWCKGFYNLRQDPWEMGFYESLKDSDPRRWMNVLAHFQRGCRPTQSTMMEDAA